LISTLEIKLPCLMVVFQHMQVDVRESPFQRRSLTGEEQLSSYSLPPTGLFDCQVRDVRILGTTGLPGRSRAKRDFYSACQLLAGIADCRNGSDGN
jgi:hypothetical protein